MPWVKLSDDWYDDPELIEAGPLAMLVWPVLVSWSARNLTDGKIPTGQIRRLVDWHTLGVEPEQAIAPLIEKGRLQDIAGGYLIVNYLKYQPSRASVLEDREKAKSRAAKSRAANVQRTSDEVQDECGDGAAPPVPVPVPDTSSSSSSSCSLESLPSGLWTAVADKKLGAAKGVNEPARWKKKVIENAKADTEFVARAVSLHQRYDLTTSQLAACLVADTNPPWLNGLERKASA